MLNAQYVRITDVDAIANGVSPPTVLESAFAPYTEEAKVEPLYTEEARRARLEGVVILEAIVTKDGTVDAIHVVQGLAFGLTDSAMDALKQWKFSPGKKDGQDVDVALSIAINFRLQPKQ